MPGLRGWLLIAVLFLLALAWRLPASWATAMLPDNSQCEVPGGTVWAGQCERLHVSGFALRNVSWQVLPEELLHGKLGVRAQVHDPLLDGSAKALVTVHGAVQGYDLLARLPLPSALVPALPAGWSGTLNLDLPRFSAVAGRLQSLSGRARLQDLQQAAPQADLGSFEWQLDDGAFKDSRLHGPLRDLGGPVRLQGTLMVGLSGEYDLDARLRAADGASDTVRQMLDSLSPADAQGFYALAVAGSL
jgi:hypothetical protein